MGDISKNFSRKEFACKCGCGFATVDTELLTLLETIRGYFKQAVRINSACRCELHNTAVGGSYGSKHKRGIAADIVVAGVESSDVFDFLCKHAPGKYGFGKYEKFTHVDVRPNKSRWEG